MKKAWLTLPVLSAALLLGARSAGETGEEREAEYAYTLREHGGFVAVYVPETEQPGTVTDIEVRNLPGTDRESLHRGIGARDERQLVMLLEDLGS